MLRRLFASVLVLGSAVVLSAPSANAQSVNMPFSGTVATNCTFGTPTAGQLSLSGTSPNTLSAEQSATGSSASASTVTLNCTAPASLSVSAPTQISGPQLSPVNCSSVVRARNLQGSPLINYPSCAGFSSPATFPNNLANPTLEVFMSVQTAGAIPSGTYGYEVILTLTP
jgi:hypothetical protein